MPVSSAKRPKDVRRLVVGKVPVHLRIILEDPARDEFIFFRYGDKLEGDAQAFPGQAIHLPVGVGLVLKVLGDDRYKIAWYGHDNCQDPDTALRCGYTQIWVQQVKAPSKKGRESKKKNGAQIADLEGPSTAHY